MDRVRCVCVSKIEHASCNVASQYRVVKPLYELITGETRDAQTKEETLPIVKAAGKIFMDRTNKCAQDKTVRNSPDSDDHMKMVQTIAGILVGR